MPTPARALPQPGTLLVWTSNLTRWSQGELDCFPSATSRLRVSAPGWGVFAPVDALTVPQQACPDPSALSAEERSPAGLQLPVALQAINKLLYCPLLAPLT